MSFRYIGVIRQAVYWKGGNWALEVDATVVKSDQEVCFLHQEIRSVRY